MGSTVTFWNLQGFLFAAVILSGLLAGLFYGFQCSVINGLSGLSDLEYLRAFQAINRAIQNPWFFLSFTGSLIMLGISCWMCFKLDQEISAYLLLMATIIYLLGVFGITIFGNVPLNNLLEQVDLATTGEQALRDLRQQFENNWNRYHLWRTVLAGISFGLGTASLLSLR